MRAPIHKRWKSFTPTYTETWPGEALYSQLRSNLTPQRTQPYQRTQVLTNTKAKSSSGGPPRRRSWKIGVSRQSRAAVRTIIGLRRRLQGRRRVRRDRVLSRPLLRPPRAPAPVHNSTPVLYRIQQVSLLFTRYLPIHPGQRRTPHPQDHRWPRPR